MIKPTVINKVKFGLGTLLLFGLSFILQVNFALPLFLLTLVIYQKISSEGRESCTLLYPVFLFVIIFSISFFIIRRGYSIYLIPFCAIPMLASLLFNDLRMSLLIGFASAVSIAAIAGNNLSIALLFGISGIICSILLLGVRRRTAIIKAGILIGCVQALTSFLLTRFQTVDLEPYVLLLLNGVVYGIIVVGILPVFEYLFNTVTNIRLLELADFDNPILQKLMMQAPGTYHHSLVVGNLSDAACQAVGANALLARIGAYYHDIGKLSKPEYYSENQDIVGNKHDTLAPTVSKMVIMNHVKEGIELARKARLNWRLIDFIQQHHGTSLVYFFYRRALENLDEKEVGEEGFRYPGPKPSTRESAIVLLADSVEAAARALKEPNQASIAELVHKIINNKFIDGQLDACDLTLKDLEKISAVFIRILGGIYHSRVTYPETQSS
jgi:cyclic-di-AMP phosphodiesterase PgpH